MTAPADIKPVPALLSVHDVMPATLPAVQALLAELARRDLSPVTLLVVPDKSWNDADLAVLRRFQDNGVSLAGHGWRHHAGRIRSPRHRLHSALISRQAGEHLSLDKAEIAALISRCHAWFEARELEAPDLYVPPAWALGSIDRAQLRRLPFRRFETLAGVYDTAANRFVRLPLIGFEAYPAWRSPLLRLWNTLNLRMARPAAPVRISIHPNDLSLALARDLLALLERPLTCGRYEELG